MHFIDLGAQQLLIRDRIDARIRQVLDRGSYILGPEVEELEQRLCAYVGVRHCITCANGTDALLIALKALNIGAGDEVLVPAFSFFASAEAVALAGATPVFVDVDARSYNIDVDAIESHIGSRTRAIIAVSLFGQCAAIPEINAIAARHGLRVIEDGAQSFGATRSGIRSCGLSEIGCTSFFPSKPLGCYGDGGALFTDDDELAAEMRCIARHGQTRRYVHARIGLNSRLDTLQAAVLLEKLEIFDQELAARSRIAGRYSELLAGTGVELPVIDEDNQSVWAQYTVALGRRDELARMLAERGIPTAVHYPLTLPRQPAFALDQSCAVAERAARRVLSLPMHPYLTHDQLVRVTGAIEESGLCPGL
jgi:UDP-2-acetamido-2-deoxy-ribo-hexuluronate aminotransferase